MRKGGSEKLGPQNWRGSTESEPTQEKRHLWDIATCSELTPKREGRWWNGTMIQRIVKRLMAFLNFSKPTACLERWLSG